jgi:hypothetical protein
MQFGDEEETGENEPEPVPATATPANERQFPTKVNAPAPVFHPLAYRSVVAEWPVEWRERWGRRANELEEKGLAWRDAEALAFVEIWKELREHATQAAAAAELAAPGPERN